MPFPEAPTVPIWNASADEVRALLGKSGQGELSLLDVRMEPEYEEFHLPGAMLLPLPELPDRLEELDRKKTVVVYCRSGMRSAAAARLLAGAGFPRVINMLGGAMAWRGAAAAGPPDSGLTLLSGQETPREILLAALGMEAALGAFYQTLGAATDDAEIRDVFERLAKFEQRHLRHVHALYREISGDETELAALLAGTAAVLEGGLPGREFLDRLGGEPESPDQALELAASVEAQALDLYSRLASRAGDATSAGLLATLAQEEKSHLRSVSNLMTRPATRSGG